MRLAEEGFDPVLGARPLKRVIQRRIQNKLAMRILKSEVKEGDRVAVEVSPSGELAFRCEPVAEAVPA
jgi:ATP-dependent Clp protease ATP-binding subunit ClpB